MHRRDVIKCLVTVALPVALPGCGSVRVASPPISATRVRPGEPAWPGAAEWQQLKDAVGGNLMDVHPLFGACETEPSGAACAEAVKEIGNPFYIGDQPGGTQVSGWLDAWTPQPSAYAVRARNAADVAAAVAFARSKNLRLVVKGGGHSYQGTSNAADSLLIWTRAMNDIALHDAFVARGCESRQAPLPAVTIGAGAVWMDVYDAVTTKAGRYVQGGGCATVGVAGLIQSGGFGSFSKRYGLAAAGLLEAEIVTADGVVRIANACTNTDLFWALKGGGGGSLGVVTALTLQTRDLPDTFGDVSVKIKANSDAAFRRLIETFLRFYADTLFNPHWGESVGFGHTNTLDVSMVFQGLARSEAEEPWRRFLAGLNGNTSDYTITSPFAFEIMAAQKWWDIDYLQKYSIGSVTPDPRPGAPKSHAWWQGDQEQVGSFIHGAESLWLPELLLKPERLAVLADAIFAASRHRGLDLHFNKGLAGAPAAAIAGARQAATNPAVADAFALVLIGGSGPPAYPGLAQPAPDLSAARKKAHEIDLATAELRKLAPNAGSYVSESNYFNPSWQQAFWGANYPRLRAVKARYDPDGLFFVHHGVGSEEWSADGFTRLTSG